jgi:hypothetical protein
MLKEVSGMLEGMRLEYWREESAVLEVRSLEYLVEELGILKGIIWSN